MSQWRQASENTGKASINLALESLDNPPEQESESESWLMSYLDTLTLLLTMFVVLLTFADFTEPENPAESMIISTKPGGETAPQAEVEPVAEPEAPLGGLLLEGLGDSVQVVVEQDRVNLAISDQILFSTAEAQLTPEGLKTLDPLVPILQRGDQRVTVEGHTDDRPITTEHFPSNWELSAARAASVVRYLQRQGVASDRLRAVGYADTQPVADNETAEGRATNRRVEIVIHQTTGETQPGDKVKD